MEVLFDIIRHLQVQCLALDWILPAFDKIKIRTTIQ
jgi:hypothetical protein